MADKLNTGEQALALLEDAGVDLDTIEMVFDLLVVHFAWREVDGIVELADDAAEKGTEEWADEIADLVIGRQSDYAYSEEWFQTHPRIELGDPEPDPAEEFEKEMARFWASGLIFHAVPDPQPEPEPASMSEMRELIQQLAGIALERTRGEAPSDASDCGC